MRVNECFRAYPAPPGECDLLAIYSEKTFSRIADWSGQDARWRELAALEEVRINGELLRGLPRLETAIRERVAGLCQEAELCIVHGDYCFSNILFEVDSQIVRLVDPRGSFGQPGIYGDPRYDIAKLRHSVGGRYDFIVADMFEVQDLDGGLEYTLFDDHVDPGVVRDFDGLIQRHGYALDEIRLIEGLLFVSMLPLHSDAPKRQRVMFSRGLELLNEVCHEDRG